MKITPPLSSIRVRINYSNVKYLEDMNGKTRVHFIDGTNLILNKKIEDADKEIKAGFTATTVK